MNTFIALLLASPFLLGAAAVIYWKIEMAIEGRPYRSPIRGR